MNIPKIQIFKNWICITLSLVFFRLTILLFLILILKKKPTKIINDIIKHK